MPLVPDNGPYPWEKKDDLQKRETEYLLFQEAITKPNVKTRVWLITSRRHGDVLGRIAWHGPWRQYIFAPSPATLFNRGCLADIDKFLEDAMTDWRESKRAASTT